MNHLLDLKTIWSELGLTLVKKKSKIKIVKLNQSYLPFASSILYYLKEEDLVLKDGI